jgi:membrane protease YdiL (CAAX protease family)
LTDPEISRGEARTASRQAAVFLALALLASWSLYGIFIASARGWIPARIPPNSLPAFVPGIVALILTALREGRPGLGKLLGAVAAWRLPVRFPLAALLGVPAMMGVSLAVLRLLGGKTVPSPNAPGPAVALLMLAVILVFGGPLGEEIGWRGYALPRLLRRFSPAAATILIWIVWFLYHLPLFAIPGSAQQAFPMGWFAAALAGEAFLLTGLFLASRGSVLMCILFHTGNNFGWWAIETYFPGVSGDGRFGYTYMAILLASAAAAGWWSQGHNPFRTLVPDQRVTMRNQP